MKKLIDSQGKVFGKINIFDFLAIIIFFIVVFIGILKINDFFEYRKRKSELKKQQELLKLKSIKAKESYFIAYVPADLLKYFEPGKQLDKNFQIIDIMRKSHLLRYSQKDSILDCALYRKEKELYNVIFRGKILLYEYRKDSVFFYDMKYIKGGSYEIELAGKKIRFSEIEYSKDFYYVDKNYVIKNISPKLAHIIKPGIVFYNNYLDTIAVVKEVLSVTQTYSYENILNERSKLYSQNLDMNVKLRLKLYKYQNKVYLNNFRLLSNYFDAFLKRDTIDFIYTRFSLNIFDDKKTKEDEFKFLQGIIVVHGLGRKEVSYFRNGMVFFTEKGDTAGIIRKVLHKGYDYFYDNRFINSKKGFRIDFDKDTYCIIGQADLVCKNVKNNIYFDKYVIYPHGNSFAKAFFPLEGVNIIKNCNITFDELIGDRENKFVIIVSDNFSLPADIVSSNNGYSIVGRVLERLGRNKYLVKLKVGYFSNFYYFENNRINVYNRYTFLIRNRKKIFSTYGYFVPNKRVRLTLETNVIPDKEDFNNLADYVKIVNIDKDTKHIELLLDVFEIDGKFYYLSGTPLPSIGMDISIDTKAGRLSGKITGRNDVDD